MTEALRTLDVLCVLDAVLIPRLVPLVTALPVSLDSMEFLLHHSATFSADSAALFQAFFTSPSSSFQVADPLAAHELLAFCVRNKSALATKTTLFSTHFPPLLKALAWHPLAAFDSVCELLPLMITPETYLELLHSVIDLPLMAAAMEEMERKSGRESGADYDDAAVPVTPSAQVSITRVPTNPQTHTCVCGRRLIRDCLTFFLEVDQPSLASDPVGASNAG